MTTPYQKILVAIDGSAVSDAGVAEAVKLAKLTGATLRLVNVIDDLSFAMAAGAAIVSSSLDSLREAGQRLLNERKAEVEKEGVPAESALAEVSGIRVCDAVANQARDWNADLIVIGTHGRRGVGRLLLGSDAEQIVRIAPVPVLLVRPQ